jgi:uncharacterized membrane-anchored protein
MKPSVARAFVLFGALAVLGFVNHAYYEKERVIRSGESLYLALVPIDPRSLMQGDYMALRFALAESIEEARRLGKLEPTVRAAPIIVDDRRIARLEPAGSESRIRFKIRNGSVWLGTNAYFFSEGTGARYTNARYGEFKLDRQSGEAVLVGLADEKLNRL